jgi:ABC-type Zn uptake system ZnuABC Zn-binding protein ZnuA
MPALAGALVGMYLLAAQGCHRARDVWAGQAGPPRVVVTIAPLYSFVKAVAGDRAGVICLCKDKGPHDYQYDTSDLQILQGADVFFSIGLTLDDKFANKLATRSSNSRLRHVRLGELLPHEELLHLHHSKDGDHDHGDHKHDHGEHDPHVWLGIDQAIGMVGTIRDELTRLDSAGKDDYQRNAAAYVKRLEKLKKDGRTMLAKKKNKRLISFHESLAYFASTYGLDIVDVIEIGAGDEPSPGHLAHLVKLCLKLKKANNPVAAIAVEPQYPKNTSAKVVQRELEGKGVTIEMIEIDPLETTKPDELEKLGADWYEKKVRENLRALAEQLP